MNEEFKPCPFCGKSDHIHISRPYKNLWCVACFNCDCCVGWSGSLKTKEQAIDAWNRRVADGNRPES